MPELSELLQTRAICETGYTYVLFHGTTVNFNKVDISESNPYTDFGKGFYLTSIFEQAVEWAGKKRARCVDLKSLSGIPFAYVLKYELSLEKLEKMKYKIYNGYTKEWLDKVSACRDRKLTQHNQVVQEFDVTIGPMADNNVGVVLERYWTRKYNEEKTLELLQFKKPNMQIAFHTERSLKAIERIDNTLKIK